MKKIEPCPFCLRSDTLRVGRSKPYLYVECKNCWAHGPAHQDRELAIDAWNKVSKKLFMAMIDEENKSNTCACKKLVPMGPKFIQSGVKVELVAAAMDGSHADAKLTCNTCGTSHTRRFKSEDPGDIWVTHV